MEINNNKILETYKNNNSKLNLKFNELHENINNTIEELRCLYLDKE